MRFVRASDCPLSQREDDSLGSLRGISMVLCKTLGDSAKWSLVKKKESEHNSSLTTRYNGITQRNRERNITFAFRSIKTV